MRPHALFPPALFVVGLTAVGWALLREATGPMSPGAALRIAAVVVYVGWLVAEARVTFRAAPGETGAQDRGTVYLYGLARLATAGTALLVPAAWSSVPLQAAGLALLLGAIAFRLSAIRRLGRFYAHQVRTLDDHDVVRDGPYRWVRHPAYLGMVGAHAGLALVFPSVAAAVAVALLLLPAVALRIRVEERALLTVPGWAAYAAGRKRLVPAVW